MIIKEADIFIQAGPATEIIMSVNRGYAGLENQQRQSIPKNLRYHQKILRMNRNFSVFLKLNFLYMSVQRKDL